MGIIILQIRDKLRHGYTYNYYEFNKSIIYGLNVKDNNEGFFITKYDVNHYYVNINNGNLDVLYTIYDNKSDLIKYLKYFL